MGELLNPPMDNTPIVVKDNNEKLVYKGQGEGNTKWKGWKLKLLLVMLSIVFGYYKRGYLFLG